MANSSIDFHTYGRNERGFGESLRCVCDPCLNLAPYHLRLTECRVEGEVILFDGDVCKKHARIKVTELAPAYVDSIPV